MPSNAGRDQRTTRHMLVLFGILLLVAGTATIFLNARKANADVREIRAVYERVMECVRRNDVEGLRVVAGPGTWAWAESILDAARHSDASGLAKRDAYDMVQILTLRVDHSRAELASMTPSDVLDLPVETGDGFQLSDIAVVGDSATATVAYGRVHVFSGSLFTRDKGQWKMEWHLLAISILNRLHGTPTNPLETYRKVFRQEYKDRWDDALLTGPR